MVKVRVRFREGDREILDLASVIAHKINLQLVDLVHEQVEPPSADDFDEHRDRDERNARSPELELLKHPNERDGDDLRQDNDVQ